MIRTQELDKQEEDGNVRFVTQPIFTPSFVLFKNLGLNNQQIIDEIENLAVHRINICPSQALEVSDSIKILQEIKSGASVVKVFSKCVDFAIKEVWKYNINHQIINSWFTKSSPQKESGHHKHKNFWLTAVYYPRHQKGCKIRFVSEREDLGNFDIPVLENNIYNSDHWDYEPEEGDFIVFSAALRHKVVKNVTNATRYSIAMNILPKGKIGDGDGTLVL